MIFIIILVFTFGVTSQALMYPNQELDISLLGRIFLPAYFVIAGENDLKDVLYAAINNSLSGMNKKFYKK